MTRCVDPKTLERTAYGAGRISPQRTAIALAVEASADHAFSAEDLTAVVRRQTPGVGLATVYRAVAAMEAAGFIEQVGVRQGATIYARCVHGGHHHHLMCTECGTVADAECPMDPRAVAPEGFRVTGHSLVLYGVCPACQDRQRESAPARRRPRRDR
jgi:Fur family transcriptional regulator, ferric uptake regulator